MATRIAVVFVCLHWFVSVAFSQFENLSDESTSREKLEHYFLQADKFSEMYGVAFRTRRIMIDESKDRVFDNWNSGMTVRSKKHGVQYFCYDFYELGIQRLSTRSESLLFKGLERRRSYTLAAKRPIPKAKTVEPDIETGLRANLSTKDSFASFGIEIDPYGLVLAGRHCTRERNSNLDSNMREWLTRWKFESEKETNGVLLTTWLLEGTKSRRRQVAFDSKFGYLPTYCRVVLSSDKGNFDSEVRTIWAKDKNDRWRQSQCVVSTHSGSELVEETFDFVWSEPEELKSFLSEGDFSTMINDEYSDWSKLFSEFFDKRVRDEGQTSKEGR